MKDKMTVVYGCNGSGKTTIAKRIAELVMPEEKRNKEFEVSTDDIVIGPEHEKQVFVFDEDFVTEQVRFRRDGIDTIVMMGEQAELDGQIAKKKEDLDKVSKELGDLQTQRDKYDKANENISPLYYFDKIRDELREDGGWADIDRDLKGNTLKSRITSDVVYNLLGIEEPKASYEELRKHLITDLKLYLESENAVVIKWKADTGGRPGNLYIVNKMLKQPLDSPKLSEREQRLLNMVTMSSHYPWHFSQQNTRQLLEDGWAFCPLCLREINEQDKIDISETLTHILNKEADEYEEKLTRQLEDFAALEVEMPEFPGGLNEREVNAAKVALEQFNKVLAAVSARIEQRRRNLYERIAEPFTEEERKTYEDVLTAWKNSMAKLTKCVEAFNDSVNKRHKLYERIRNQNNLLARKQLSALLNGYKKAEDESNKNKKALEKKSSERDKVNGEINRLTAQKERIDIALDYINKELNYVFYSNKKLQLVASNNTKKYKLRVNGKPVSPDKISVGERNVLALCYFFAKLYSGKEEKKRYDSESLIVIDDPVSSFDYGNRLGVMTLLRFQFDCILNGNDNSRILVMSHDLYSVFDLVKVKSDVCGKSKDFNKEPKGYLTLENAELHPATVKNEYGILLHHIYEYAKAPILNNAETEEESEDSIESGIGNIMRKLLEGFASFCYNKNFMDMLNMKELFEPIEPKEKREYYSNFMFRLALNSESHLEDQAYSFNTMYKLFTREEKVKTAKSLLLFLLYVNRLHMESYFLEKKKDEHGEEYIDRSKIEEIESWQKDETEWLKNAENES